MFFFFNDTATTEIYTLSLHDALPISSRVMSLRRLAYATHRGAPQIQQCFWQASSLSCVWAAGRGCFRLTDILLADRKSTRLNSSHANLVCRLLLEKKKHQEVIENKQT